MEKQRVRRRPNDQLRLMSAETGWPLGGRARARGLAGVAKAREALAASRHPDARLREAS